MKKTIAILIAFLYVFHFSYASGNKDFIGIKEKKQTLLLKESLSQLRSDVVGERLSATKKIFETRDKNIVPVLIGELNSPSKSYVFEVEVLLLRVTGRGFYGICIGNKKAVIDLSRWWNEARDKYVFPDSQDYFYREYYDGSNMNYSGMWFIENANIRFWKETKELRELNNDILRCLGDENMAEDFIKKMIVRAFRQTGEFQDNYERMYAYEILYSLGKETLPIVLKELQGEYNDGLAIYFSKMSGLSTERDLEEEPQIVLTKFEKWMNESYEKYSFDYKKHSREQDDEYIPKKIKKITELKEEDVKVIKALLVNIVEKKDSMYRSSSDLVKYGELSIPYIAQKIDSSDSVVVSILIDTVRQASINGKGPQLRYGNQFNKENVETIKQWVIRKK